MSSTNSLAGPCVFLLRGRLLPWLPLLAVTGVLLMVFFAAAWRVEVVDLGVATAGAAALVAASAVLRVRRRTGAAAVGASGAMVSLTSSGSAATVRELARAGFTLFS